MRVFSKVGILTFIIFISLSVFVLISYNSCSGGGILINPCNLGPVFFLFPVTLLVTSLGLGKPLWWYDSSSYWIIAVGAFYGVMASMIVSWIEKRLKTLDKS